MSVGEKQINEKIKLSMVIRLTSKPSGETSTERTMVTEPLSTQNDPQEFKDIQYFTICSWTQFVSHMQW